MGAPVNSYQQWGAFLMLTAALLATASIAVTRYSRPFLAWLREWRDWHANVPGPAERSAAEGLPTRPRHDTGPGTLVSQSRHSRSHARNGRL